MWLCWTHKPGPPVEYFSVALGSNPFPYALVDVDETYHVFGLTPAGCTLWMRLTGRPMPPAVVPSFGELQAPSKPSIVRIPSATQPLRAGAGIKLRLSPTRAKRFGNERIWTVLAIPQKRALLPAALPARETQSTNVQPAGR